jgi:hypothetical protein
MNELWAKQHGSLLPRSSIAQGPPALADIEAVRAVQMSNGVLRESWGPLSGRRDVFRSSPPTVSATRRRP